MCIRDSRTIIKEMNSEFEYPRLASYYKAKAPEILKNIPLWIGYSSRAFLGEYDRGKKAFPFVDATGKRKTPITLNSFTMLPDRTGLGYTCGVALSAMNGRPTSLLSGGSGPRYAVTVPMTTFTYLAVDEASARQYALKAGPPGGGRSVTCLLYTSGVGSQTAPAGGSQPESSAIWPPAFPPLGTLSRIRGRPFWLCAGLDG